MAIFRIEMSHRHKQICINTITSFLRFLFFTFCIFIDSSVEIANCVKTVFLALKLGILLAFQNLQEVN